MIKRMTDIHYENQTKYCKNNKLPMFASKECYHNVSWGGINKYKDTPTKLGEMLINRYGEQEAFKISSGQLITACPICCKSWCD